MLTVKKQIVFAPKGKKGEIMKFKIVSDSSADMRTLSQVPFTSVPLKIITKETEYIDDGTIDIKAMQEAFLKYKGTSHTSCPNTAEYLEAFGDAEGVFCVTITSKLSGSYNSAISAKKAYIEEHPDRRVCVIDSLSTGPESALIIEKLEELIVSFADFDKVKEGIDEYLKKTRLIFALESMRNLANNGRVNPIVAKLAGILGVRVVGRASDEGTLEIVCKARGEKNAISDIVKNMVKDGFSDGRVRIHHANNIKFAEGVKAELLKLFPCVNAEIYEAGGLCSYYAEEGGLLVGFEV